jgi:hypothetical protein
MIRNSLLIDLRRMQHDVSQDIEETEERIERDKSLLQVSVDRLNEIDELIAEIENE